MRSAPRSNPKRGAAAWIRTWEARSSPSRNTASRACRRSESCWARVSARSPTRRREAIAVAYSELPGFPVPSVEGHAGRLVVGTIEGRRVALFQGRGHYYERGDANAMRVAIDLFKNLGGETLLLTNAAGGLHTEWKPPSLVAITDHINFSGHEPADRPRRRGPLRAADPRLRPDPDRDAAPRRARGDSRAARGRLHVVLRPELRDAGRNPRRPHARRRPRRHVDRARSDPRPPRGLARRRGLGRDQFRRRALPAAIRATTRPRNTPASPPNGSSACCAASFAPTRQNLNDAPPRRPFHHPSDGPPPPHGGEDSQPREVRDPPPPRGEATAHRTVVGAA